jgi:hypothetical protein
VSVLDGRCISAWRVSLAPFRPKLSAQPLAGHADHERVDVAVLSCSGKMFAGSNGKTMMLAPAISD